MIYLKTYENWYGNIKDNIKDKIRYRFRYKEGDYIRFIMHYTLINNELWGNSWYNAKIIKRVKDEIKQMSGAGPVYDAKYLVQTLDEEKEIRQDDIERKLTPEEIEQYILEKGTDKYNI